jgi:HK97 family phage major capsid protein
MSEFLNGMVEERQKLWHEAKAIIDVAEAEGRSLSGEEEAKYQAISADLDKKAEFIDEARSRAEREDRAAAVAAQTRVTTPEVKNNDEAILRSMVNGGGHEFRSITPSSTGAPVPTSFYNKVIELARLTGPMLQTSTVLNTASGEPLQIPSLGAYSAATVKAPGAAIDTNEPTFNSFTTLSAYKYSGLISVARELMTDSGVDLMSFIATEVGNSLGFAVNQGLTVGTGVVQPTGVTTVAGSGIVGATGGTGAFTADNIFDLIYSLDGALRQKNTFGLQMNAKSIAAVRKLKDSYGRYLFDPALSAEKRDLIGGYQVYENPAMADPGLGAKSIIAGDLSAYYVRSVGGVRLDRSDDYAFGSDLTTFRFTFRVDGNLPQTSHIKFFKGAAS